MKKAAVSEQIFNDFFKWRKIVAKKKTVKKVVKKATKKVEKHSPELRLEGTPSDFVNDIKILKNVEVPEGRWGKHYGKWDHLIVRLSTGDCIELDHRQAASFANRGRTLGYLMVLRKVNDVISRVWFEGLDPNPPSVDKG